MGSIRPVQPAKLVVGMLAAREEALLRAREGLQEAYGPLDYDSATIPFEHTRYYEREFGPGLQRVFIAFEALIDPGDLATIKRTTNELEQRWAEGERRTVNLDPGYLTPAKLVLATTKDQAHRIYLGQGIYAEVTLSYRGGAFCPWPWTYPDYRTAAYHRALADIRALYMAQLRRLTGR